MTTDYRFIHSQTVDLYERQGETWDKERRQGSFFEQSWIDKFLFDMIPDGNILDVGCGGAVPIARYIISKGFSLTGVDTSPSLLTLCRSRFPACRWIQMDMRTLNLEGKFNGIIAWDSFFHLDPNEQVKVLSDLTSMLLPNGKLLITVGPKAGEVVGSVGSEAVYHSSLSYEQYEEILKKNGMEILEFVREDPSCGLHTVMLGKKLS